MTITILRLGHRIARDTRISTHCALVARALGADSIIFSGERDQSILDSVNQASENWGGDFTATYDAKWKHVLKTFNGTKVHLTMYGLPVQKTIDEIRKQTKNKNLLIAIGAGRVPGEAYQLADFNVAVTNQPHSEVGALAVFLHEYWKGLELEKTFAHPKLRITPREKGKTIEKIPSHRGKE